MILSIYLIPHEKWLKSAGLKEFVEKAVETQKEELENLKKIVKSNEEIVNNLQNEVDLFSKDLFTGLNRKPIMKLR